MNTCVISEGRKYWSIATMQTGDKIFYSTHDDKLTEEKVAEFPFPTLHCLDDLELGHQYLGFKIIVYSIKDNNWIGQSPDGFHVRIKKVEPPSEPRDTAPSESAGDVGQMTEKEMIATQALAAYLEAHGAQGITYVRSICK